MKAEEERKRVLVQELAGLDDLAKVASWDATRLQRDVTACAADARSLLFKHVPQARQMLRKVLVGRLKLTPIDQNGRKGYRFEGYGSYGKLLAGEVEASEEVSTAATSHGVPRLPMTAVKSSER